MATQPSPLTVVRHGETEWSAAGRHTSTTELPLVAAGREAAAALAPRLAAEDFALVLCSPRLRARETCALAGFGERAEITDELAEWDYGEYEGLTTPEIRSRRPDWDLWTDGCPGGEGPEAVRARVDGVIARFAAAGGPGLAFAHGHVLRSLSARWIGLPIAGGARLLLAAAGVGRLGVDRGMRVIDQWNA